MNKQDTSIEETISQLCEGKLKIDEAVNKLLSASGVTVGATVAVVGDPTYPFDGQKGVIRKVYETGFADVEFPNGTTAKLQSSMLVPV